MLLSLCIDVTTVLGCKWSFSRCFSLGRFFFKIFDKKWAIWLTPSKRSALFTSQIRKYPGMQPRALFIGGYVTRRSLRIRDLHVTGIGSIAASGGGWQSDNNLLVFQSRYTNVAVVIKFFLKPGTGQNSTFFFVLFVLLLDRGSFLCWPSGFSL